jgi:biopolymer transport protein ExbB
MKALLFLFIAIGCLAQDAPAPALLARIAQFEQQVAAAEAEAAALATLLSGLDSALAGASERAGIHASEVPGFTAPDEPIAALDAIHAHGSGIAKSATQVRAPDGQLIDAEVLRFGHVGFVYHSESVPPAIALAAPADASGYRWQDQLPESVASAVTDAVRSGSGVVPLDISGNLRVESQIGSRSLQDLVETGGMVMGPLVAVAIIALLLMLERLIILYGQRSSRDSLVQTVLGHCRASDWPAAESACESVRGVLPRTLLACLRRRPSGASMMEDSIQEQLLHEVPRLRRRLNGIAVMAAIAPLLGLLGTVTGIIHTFETISAHGNTHPGMMAGGISEALFTTAAGLVIAIPVLLVHAVLSSRVDRLVSDTERHAATLLNTIVESDPK